MTNRIAYYRKQKRLSQRDLAKLLNVPQSRLNEWESGRHDPRLSTAIQIAQTLGVTVEEVWLQPQLGE
jgi:putative transcriptional regulator